MKLKMKLLDCTLIGLLAGLSPLAAAQEAVPPETDPAGDASRRDAAPEGDTAPAVPDCASGDECRSDEGLLFRLRTRGERDPITPGTDTTSPALQPDRRVTVGLPLPGKAVVTGKFSLQLPNGGVIWATEDPALGRPELSISAPSFIALVGPSAARPMPFYVRSNYSAFIERYELSLYRATDTDLVEPIATVPLDVAAVSRAEWDGVLPARHRFRTGDELIYVLRAYDAEGNFDETQPQAVQLVTPDEAERGGQRLREDTERALGTGLSTEQAQAQSLVEDAFAANDLRQQNIPIYGSRIRIQGRNLPAGRSLLINGDSYPVDLERKFAAEYLMPVGRHAFDIELRGGGDAFGAPGPQAPASAPELRETLAVDVTGRYFFGVGLADLTIAQNRIGGSAAPFAVDRRYEDDVLGDGRLAFYGKAKLRGRYLVTAQADTTERDVKHLFDGFGRADPRDIFRHLDPDLYYPTYGDDSTAWRDVDTMGRFYLRMDWDKNQALWGNYQTGITGTEYGQYVRSLYGAALDWRSRGTNRWGDPSTELRAFGSEAQTVPGHNEFVGTGGSLYYLRNTDLLPGSDQVVLEIRDRTTGRAETRVTLQRGTDYEIDTLQGRITLTRPLSMLTRENLPTITRDAPLDGYEQRLIVDYEWVPSGFDADETTAGIRGKHWLGDHVGVGLTYVDENRGGEDYTLAAGDLTLQAGRGTYLKAEYSRTQSFSAPVFFSDNGGFTFTQLNPTGPREGEAKAVEARVNFRELGWTEQDWSAAAWWRRVGAGYSISRYDTGLAIEEQGAEILGRFSASLGLYARYTQTERGAESFDQAQVTGEWRIRDSSTLTGELRHVEETRAAGKADGTLAALQYSHRIGSALDLYGTAQFTVDDGGAYTANDAYSLGGKYLFGDLSSIGAEVTHGDRGDAAQVEAEYRVTPLHSVYGGYTWSTDRTDYDPLFGSGGRNGWTLGQRWRLSNQVNLFNESQFLKERNESGLAHTFGLDFFPAVGWNLGFTLSDGELVNSAGGQVDRRAVSLSGGRTSSDTEWQSKLEWRRDSGAERRRQWVTTNRLLHKLNESLRVALRFNYADTDDEMNPAAGAKYIEGNAGFAWRSWNDARWGLFGRYTYLYDLATLAQAGGATYDQRTQVLSLEGVYRYDRNWEFAGKLARREGEARFGRGTGAWFDSATTFAAAQVRYELRQKWHALAEYRWLDVRDGGVRQGWLLGVDRDLGRNFRLGAGYNFTEFSDDLTDFDYDHRGWFVNFVGSY